MENASKALLMAASILIGVLLISLMTYVFYFSGNYSRQISENLESRTIYEINVKFELYDGRNDLTTHEVQTIFNLLDDYNFNKEESDRIDISYVGFNRNNFSILEDEDTYRFRITSFKRGRIGRVVITKN